jgi:hypothetical protein
MRSDGLADDARRRDRRAIRDDRGPGVPLDREKGGNQSGERCEEIDGERDGESFPAT